MEAALETLQNEIGSKFDEGWRRSPDFDTDFVLNECKSYFYEHCREGGKLDPRPARQDDDENAYLACRLYGYAAFKFTEIETSRRLYAAESLLLDGWARFNQIQAESGRKIYKGILAFRLVQLYETKFRDMGAACRWALLTHADDALVKHTTGMGMDRLRYSFGMSEQALSQFNEIIDSNRLDKRTEGWGALNRFADDMLVKFIRKYPHYAHLFTIPTAVLEFPPCIPYLRQLVDNVNKTRSPEQTTKQGDALEHLATYLFLLIPGFIPRSKVIPTTRDFEHDLVISNLRSSSNLEAELFGRDFLVECKNWKFKVGVSEVGYFLYRMRLTHTKFGVIFAKNGISGKTDKHSYARNLCQRAFHEDGALCIVIDDNDINNILDSKTSFRSVLMVKVNQLQFGKSK